MAGHSHDGQSHSHEASADHGHTHEILDGPGSYLGREMPIIEGRDWRERAFTVGIGGYVLFFSPLHVSIRMHYTILTLSPAPSAPAKQH